MQTTTRQGTPATSPAPKKSLGQHFLRNPDICRRIAALANLQDEDLVLEIGPGPGALTKVLETLPHSRLLLLEKDAHWANVRKTEAEARNGSGSGANKAVAYANALPVFKRGRTFYIEVINPVHYASYVEFGHRTRGGGGWVAGQYFLTLSERDLERVAPAVIEKKLEALLREAFNV